MKLKRWHLYVVAAVIVLVVLFLAGKQLAAVLGVGLAFLGMGKGAIDKKREKNIEKAKDEEKIMDKVKNDIEKRKEKEQELKEKDIKNVETAEKLEEKDKELDKKSENLKDRLSEHTKE